MRIALKSSCISSFRDRAPRIASLEDRRATRSGTLPIRRAVSRTPAPRALRPQKIGDLYHKSEPLDNHQPLHIE